MESNRSIIILNKNYILDTINLFYQNQFFSIPKVYLENINKILSKENLLKFLSNADEARKLESFLPANIVKSLFYKCLFITLTNFF